MREIARRENLSQNEFIEQAIENEVVVRGAALAEDLAAASQRLTQLTQAHYETILQRSIDVFVHGEAGREALQAVALHSGDEHRLALVRQSASSDELGVLAAFQSARG